VTLVRVDETDSGSDFLILNLQMVTRVEGRNFKDEQDKHQGRVFSPTAEASTSSARMPIG
jgi:hypothetical protein